MTQTEEKTKSTMPDVALEGGLRYGADSRRSFGSDAQASGSTL